MSQGLFITLEGPEGAGKTTQLARLEARLRAAGHAVTVTREPGGTPLGTRVREVVLDPAVEIEPLGEFLLYSASRAQLVREVLRPALERGETVLCDRYADSSLAYQGAGRGLSLPLLRQITAEVTGGLTPGLTVLLDLDPALGLQRAARRGQPDRLEQADLTFHRRVRQGFLDLAHAEPQRFLVLDATRPEDELEAEIWAAVSERGH
ncbi:dTMP kinase [Deinococcus radiodurans]|uniref:Thymidylate kinase n=1 Tax=Deinococcus radiodurans (strain ATCC 13939 / DSM 20539 / JCM 16871 / CCUG 27074 / LMG 4051 / NBRC 15346 / NCIMB 9279 / VKM B-1422 / R1) TaxID=243230 RepID=KTHY_DEIRA|nr:dTMP kinase [Deinococcus radiodurans]Q9RY40.1 RecName: Full=Thymidylate kinase; AltName: Full=dTMP kinase [Deinococcus radiodurans R1 = ATCC 13939 = DSM 20539]AAF09698.1 thymidylate kinase [Deinococcus radiodurans R1 = ATCC 13939 = DSM 20539]ANC72601.1 dTMP kinase [Deinococcus radiodurans R1 = ATCC 13939 = DSM 20539]QEM72084.1 dTMP kinase [Deinococcus radiodurans]QIP28356.1 dTMP kinase [Deinococcus radiodurans]QIP30771.1 dTMP kinase [Deinococcus radiodurans]